MPFIKPILSTITGGRDLKFPVPGTEVELDLDKVTASTIKFAALSVIIFIMIQLGVKIKKPVQWVSVRNWDKMKTSKNTNKSLNNTRNNKQGFKL